MLRVDRCPDMEKLINIEPDPDHRPDAGSTRLLSPISYALALQRAEFYYRYVGIPRIQILSMVIRLPPAAAATSDLQH